MTVRHKRIDLVLAGGGVKGIGLVGAVVKLMDAGYRPYRIAGTSAGAIVGSIVAAASTDKAMSPEGVKELALSIDYSKFLDTGAIKGVPLVGTTWGLFEGNGLFRGDYAHDFIATQLKNQGVETFGDLRLDDDELPEERRYRLAVTVADVTRGQLVRLPWDYQRVYGLKADDQPVADAVRASMSIPFFFRPVTLTSASGKKSTLVDGGLISNFPIDSLDRPDGKKGRWVTFGVTVLPNLPDGADKVVPGLPALRLLGGNQLIEQVISTVLVGRDQAYLDLPRVSARAIRVDSTDVGVLDFDIRDEQTKALYARGYEAAETFLETWDEEAYDRLVRG